MEVGGVRSEKVRRGGPLKCGPEGCLTRGLREERFGKSRGVALSQCPVESWRRCGEEAAQRRGLGQGRAGGMLQGDLGHQWAPAQGAAGRHTWTQTTAFLSLTQL